MISVPVLLWYGMVLMCCVVLWHGHGHYTLIATRQVQVSYCMMCDQIATRKESKTVFFTSEERQKANERKTNCQTNTPKPTESIRTSACVAEIESEIGSPIGIYHCTNNICS